MTFDPKLIRNFSIIAHIDHGKSTLADRLLEFTHAVPERDMVDQVLDTMDLERERGITIKAQAVRIPYRPPATAGQRGKPGPEAKAGPKAKAGPTYSLNLIDTPGHVDFTYEVSRSLAACEGALLVVDAAQGVEAQTVANAFLALENDLEVIPIINKIDLASADPDRVKHEIEESLGLPAGDALMISAKTGLGVPEVLQAVVDRIPPPTGDAAAPLRALIFDSVYDAYRGVIAFVRVIDGSVGKGSKIRMMATGTEVDVEEVGIFAPVRTKVERLNGGEVGYLIAGMKDVRQSKVGDTVTEAARPTAQALPGYREPKPMVFCGLYPLDGGAYEELRRALAKLRLNDPAFNYEPETSQALGFGFRCGFLGLLHMEIVKERLEREYSLELVATAPTVAYRVRHPGRPDEMVSNPADFPPPARDIAVDEPYVLITVLVPPDYLGAIMDLCQERRGVSKDMQYLSTTRVQLHYELPLSEILLDFFGQLKSRSRGYASLDYEHIGYRPGDLVRLEILLAGEAADAFSMIVPRKQAPVRGRELVAKLKDVIPRQMFDVPVQAAIGAKIVARETIKAKRKDVVAKCYGGDVTRKRKLLERQKAGKKRMKQIGRVEVPQEAFLTLLKVEETK